MLQNDERMNQAVEPVIGELINGAEKVRRSDKINILDRYTICIGTGLRQHRNRNVDTIDVAEAGLRSQGQDKPADTTAKVESEPPPSDRSYQRLNSGQTLQNMLTPRFKENTSIVFADYITTKRLISQYTIVRVLGAKSLPRLVRIVNKKRH